MTIRPNTDSDEHVFQESNAMQVARWVGQRESITTSGVSQRITLPAGTTLLEITAQQAVYLNFGDATVVASSAIDNKSATDNGNRLFISGVQTIPVPLDDNNEPWTHLAVVQEASAGVFQVEQLQ